MYPEGLSRAGELWWHVLLSFGLAAQPPDTSAAAVVARATTAVELDSTGSLGQTWSASLRGTDGDRLALLGLATLARLTSDDSATAWYRRLLGDQDEVGGYARVGLAELDRLSRSLPAAAAGFRDAERIGLALGNRRMQSEALLGLARVLARTEPVDSTLGALARADRLLDRESPLLAELRCFRAEILLQAGREGVRAEIDRGMVLARSAGDRRRVAGCWRALGALYINSVDDPARSRVPFDSAEVLDRKTRDRIGLAETLAARALDRFSYLDLTAAAQELDSALVYAGRTGHRRIEAVVHQMRGQIAFVLGDFPTAVRLQAAVDSTLAGLGDRVSELHAVMIRGRLALRLGRLDEAESATRTVLSSAETLNRSTNIYLARLGLIFIRGARGNWSGSVNELDGVIEYMRSHGLTAWIPGLGYSRGLALLRQGDLRSAEGEFRTALRNASSGEALLRYQASSRLAEVLARTGESNAAVLTLARATDELDAYRARVSSADLRTLVFQATAAGDEPDLGLATIVSALVGRGRILDGYQLAERRKARELADRLLRAQFARLGAGKDSVTRPSIVVLGREELAAVTPGDSAALLVFVTGRGGQPTTAFIRTGADLRAAAVLPVDSIEADLSRLNALVRTGTESQTLRRGLGLRLLDPALRELHSSVRHLTIVPDDGLHMVPWDALVLANGRPVLDRFTVTVAPSVTIAGHLASRAVSRAETRVLALGDPRFANESEKRGDARADIYRSAFETSGGLPRLRGSAAEARAVARFGRESMVHLRERASEAFLKQAPLDSFRVLHLATHALVSDGSPSETSLALSPGNGEDGFVGPGELAILRLGADLVVLSACRTAGGVVVGGEGIQGLTAPLLTAGARAVVATLWPVRDEAVAEFMRAFYATLAEGRTVRDALRAAKLEAMDRAAPAAEWAAFVLMGDGSVPIPVEAPQGWGLPWPATAAAAGGVLLLLYGAAVRSRRKSEAA